MSGFYLCHAYAFCLLWGFSQPLSPLYPITFLYLGIQSNFLFLIPKVFLRFGHSYCFCLSIPKVFLRSGYSYCFCLSIPKVFLRSGYPYGFLLLYTQAFSPFWVFIRLFASLYPSIFSVLGIHAAFLSLYPKFFLALGIYLTFVSSIPKHLYSSAYNRCFSLHRTVSLSFYAMTSALTPPRSPALICDAAPVRAVTGPVSYPQ